MRIKLPGCNGPCPIPDGITCPREKCTYYKPTLGDLYRAVEDAGAIPDSKLKPKEGAPDYIAVILTCDSEHEARGDSHEEATVNVIAMVNAEAERGQDNG